MIRLVVSAEDISIHALREEGDMEAMAWLIFRGYFYPRPPRGGRLRGLHWRGYRRGDFYPRPPRGGRLLVLVGIKHVDKFLSTPSARRATGTAQCTQAGRSISIHALREEGDLYSASCSFSRRVFLSTPSARRATTLRISSDKLRGDFYPRPPRGGRLCVSK